MQNAAVQENCYKGSLGQAVEGIASQLGLGTEALAGVLGLSPLECARLLAGKTSFSANSEAMDRFAMLCDIHRGLARLFEHDLKRIRNWMHVESKAFPGTPLEEADTLEGLGVILDRVGELLEVRESARKIYAFN